MDEYIIVAKNMPQMAKDNLIKLGFNLIESAELKTVHKGLKYHPDMQIVKGDGCYICAPCCYDHYKLYFENIGIKLIKGKNDPKENYPYDVPYNVAIVDNYAIHNFEFTDSKVSENLNCEKINVNQGYSKCSICVVSDNAVITSDKGIAKVLTSYDIDVLAVTEGYIELEPFKYGFIGGCSGIISDDKIAFCGDISLHPDYEKIKEFCHKHGKKIVCLTNSKPVDVGTIMLLG